MSWMASASLPSMLGFGGADGDARPMMLLVGASVIRLTSAGHCGNSGRLLLAAGAGAGASCAAAGIGSGFLAALRPGPRRFTCLAGVGGLGLAPATTMVSCARLFFIWPVLR